MTNNIILRDYEDKKWLHFQQPIEVLSTRDLNQVLPILQKVEELVNSQQYYAAGFISYEASAAFDSALTTHKNDDFPLIWFGLYEKPTVFEFKNYPKATTPIFDWIPSISKKEYFEALEKVRYYIKKGDTYQVNFTMRQLGEIVENRPPAPKGELNPSDEQLYQDKTKANSSLKYNNQFSKLPASDSPLGAGSELANNTAFSFFQDIAQSAPYGAFIDIENFSICSASPELFFKIKDDKITSSPMKGTAPRGRTNEEDSFFKNQLKNSQKDRSENVMIVDMIRNDLSKIAAIGSVHTPRLFEIEKYQTVLQMTSTVEGKTTASLSELMTALFPCASITGAPKSSTMRIISELENTPRRIYTGTIGFIKPDGDMQFNVAIRTALFDKKNGRIEYGTGGGITIKSDTQKEYEECILKTKIISQKRDNQYFKLLETMLWSPKNGWFLLEKHLARLADSAVYFDYKIDIEKIRKALFRQIDKFKTSAQKVRLLVGKDERFVIENHEIDVENISQKTDVADTLRSIRYQQTKPVQLATSPVDSTNPFLFHKTTNRGVYESNLRQFPDAKDVILWNERGEITESCYGNVVFFDGKNYWTPPIECGLLNGTFRQFLLEKGTVHERVILKKELEEMEAVFLVNSVRKWERVVLILEIEQN